MSWRQALIVAALAVDVHVLAVDLYAQSGTADDGVITVPACPSISYVQYTSSVPNTDTTPFPLTKVGLCYSDTAISLEFTAYNETDFYFDPSQTTNDPIYNYEVMEAFISRGSETPQTYLEFEVSPNNVTFQAFIYNPSKVRAAGAAMDTMYLSDPIADGLLATTSIDKPNEMWKSFVQVPLGLFNVDNGAASGTQWRMNFFRTVVAPNTFPTQQLGAWRPTNESNFHMTPFFGHVNFV